MRRRARIQRCATWTPTSTFALSRGFLCRAGSTLTTLPKAQARQVAPATVHAAMVAGEEKALYEALDKDATLAAAGYRYVMVHGRLNAFEKVKALAKDKRAGVHLAALEAPRNMQNWSPKDRASICPWARELLRDERPMVSFKGAALLSRCSGEYVDALLADGEAALESGSFSRAKLAAHRDVCSAMRRRQGGATDAQCQRNRKLLTEAARNQDLDPRTRSLALTAIAYQWPDRESLALAKELSADKARDLASTSQQTIQRLETRGQPSPAKAPAAPPSRHQDAP